MLALLARGDEVSSRRYHHPREEEDFKALATSDEGTHRPTGGGDINVLPGGAPREFRVARHPELNGYALRFSTGGDDRFLCFDERRKGLWMWCIDEEWGGEEKREWVKDPCTFVPEKFWDWLTREEQLYSGDAEGHSS